MPSISPRLFHSWYPIHIYTWFIIVSCEKVMADSMHFLFSNNGTEKTKCNFQCHGADYIKIYRQHGIYSMSPAILTILMFLCRCLLARRKSQVVPWSTVICRALLYCCNVCLFRKILLFCWLYNQKIRVIWGVHELRNLEKRWICLRGILAGGTRWP